MLGVRFLLALLIATSLSAATVDGIQLHSSSKGNGPRTVILVHGWTCDDTTWESQVPVLSKEYRVVTLDLPGHGKSGSPEDGALSMDLFARAVEAVRAETRADCIVVVGRSMGTPVIVQYAHLYPQPTAAMVFVDGLVAISTGNVRGGGPPSAAQMGGPDGKSPRAHDPRHVFSRHDS
jgi:pimeloyl-ACP methyl ester carboxylesterase